MEGRRGKSALEFLVLLPKAIDVALNTKELYMSIGRKRFAVGYITFDSKDGKIYASLYGREE